MCLSSWRFISPRSVAGPASSPGIWESLRAARTTVILPAQRSNCDYIPFAMEKKSISFTTVEGDMGEQLDKIFGAKPSFPRTGSNWAQEMVWCIGNDFDYEKAKTLLVLRNPLLESSSLMVSGDYVKAFAQLGDSVEMVAKMPRTRYIKSHLPVELLPLC